MIYTYYKWKTRRKSPTIFLFKKISLELISHHQSWEICDKILCNKYKIIIYLRKYIYIYFLTEPLKYKSYAINPYTSLNNRTALVQRADKANSISPDTPFFHVQGNHSRPRRRKYRRMKIQRQWGLNDPHKTRDRWFARCSSSRLIVISEGRAMH